MEDIQYIKNYLSAHGIRKTPPRIELLGLFISSKHGLSHKDIKERITSTQDNVTIYRTLNTFCEKGLIHKVPDSNNTAKYALCLPKCTEKPHCNDHIHFICNKCNNTFCMNDTKIPEIQKTKGFKVKSLSITLEGECPDCCTTKEH